jgi:hypothetical protein
MISNRNRPLFRAAALAGLAALGWLAQAPPVQSQGQPDTALRHHLFFRSLLPEAVYELIPCSYLFQWAPLVSSWLVGSSSIRKFGGS